MWQSLRLHARQKCRRVRWRRVGVCLLLLCSVRWLRSGGAGQPTSFTQPQASSPPPPSPAPRAICQVPHVLHQTWKSREVQSLFVPRITSWFKVNPGWEYRFWTDADNRALIRDHFPESLAMFDGYHSAIQRADAIRYFILYKYGGVYADLDFEALQPLGDLLARPEHQDTGVLLGQEPLAHARVLYDQPRMLCNAIMISCAGHPFWAAVIAELHKRYDAGIKTVRATGPRMLNDVVEAWLNVSSESTHTAMPKVAVAKPGVFYPEFDSGNTRIRETCDRKKCLECKGPGRHGGPLSTEQEKQCRVLAKANFANPSHHGPDAFATHHWAHTWLGKSLYGPTINVDKVAKKAQIKLQQGGA